MQRIIIYFSLEGNTEYTFYKLKECIGIENFAATAIFIDPKEKPSEENVHKLSEFCRML
jgi:flavodoxin